MRKAQIREIFMQAGFTIKEGQSDLKPYVYDAAYELLSARDEQTLAKPIADRLIDAMGAYLRVCGSGGMPKTTRLTIERAFSEALRLGYLDETLLAVSDAALDRAAATCERLANQAAKFANGPEQGAFLRGAEEIREQKGTL